MEWYSFVTDCFNFVLLEFGQVRQTPDDPISSILGDPKQMNENIPFDIISSNLLNNFAPELWRFL